ncbi:MAG: polyprenyl diphosphate synthase, partial [Pseudomonadota bacterium]
GLFRRYILREVEELDSHDIRVRFIGQRERMPADLQRLMAQTEARTAENRRLTIQVALSYGARAEIAAAARAVAEDVAAGRLAPEDVDEDALGARLWTAGIDDPDLVIRTSGEVRVSNFLLWQAAYAEFAFVEECWPDFTAERFREVLAGFGRRERRFGRVTG